MRNPPPAPSQEGESVFPRARTMGARPQTPEVKHASDKRYPRKKGFPLLGGSRGWAVLALLMSVTPCATLMSSEDLMIKDTASGEVFYITVVPGSRALAATRSKATLSAASLPSVATPSITSLTIDGKTVEDNDYVAEKPTFLATISPGSGGDIASYNIRIVDASTESLVTSTENVLSPTSGITIAPQFVPVTALQGGRTYRAMVSASDSSGLTATVMSPVFQVDVGFKLHGLINGPNPFNPNKEATYIEYQLTKAADVTIHIYSISGERLWRREIVAGSVGFNSVMWDGRNHYGETVANGVYIAYVVAKHDGEKATGKIKMAVLK